MIESFERAVGSLTGLSVADALGAQFFVPHNRTHFEQRSSPPGPWPWTDDTEMAAVLVTHLQRNGTVNQDRLAAEFAAAFDLYRGYGPATGRLLRQVRDGADWRSLVRETFDGQGSLGNGAAMRVAPLGAWYASDPGEAARQAIASAEVTHAHPEGIAGAVAVAVAAASVAAEPSPTRLWEAVREFTPPGAVATGAREAAGIPVDSVAADVARLLGNGSRTTAADTVPFCLWTAARHLHDYEAAFWATASAGGDVDTTCAITCGIVAAAGTTVPQHWRTAREALAEPQLELSTGAGSFAPRRAQ